MIISRYTFKTKQEWYYRNTFFTESGKLITTSEMHGPFQTRDEAKKDYLFLWDDINEAIVFKA